MYGWQDALAPNSYIINPHQAQFALSKRLNKLRFPGSPRKLMVTIADLHPVTCDKYDIYYYNNGIQVID